MAVMQTPHGRVIGLILNNEDQPMKEAVEKNDPSAPTGAPPLGASAEAGEAMVEAKVEAKPATVKKAGRPAKK